MSQAPDVFVRAVPRRVMSGSVMVGAFRAMSDAFTVPLHGVEGKIPVWGVGET
ncbi:MAG: hypothetical protein AAFV33_18190 [Chloroflexota bacterium]